MGVNLCCSAGAVPDQGLDVTQVRALLEQVRGEALEFFEPGAAAEAPKAVIDFFAVLEGELNERPAFVLERLQTYDGKLWLRL